MAAILSRLLCVGLERALVEIAGHRAGLDQANVDIEGAYLVIERLGIALDGELASGIMIRVLRGMNPSALLRLMMRLSPHAGIDGNTGLMTPTTPNRLTS
ncbi:hypothetical protein [Ancylobacter sp. FA202]|uniref:hypothetical protein n=1 Tax=Ancylobacter sp. FA202 TaxID=1111106 RepID=UPI0003734FE3|nr:hypothetical protein [Ancylobacter sp. FA202]